MAQRWWCGPIARQREAPVCQLAQCVDTTASRRASEAASAALAFEEARRQRVELEAADLSARLAAVAEAKLDADILISDLKSRVWDEEARADLLQAMTRPGIVRDAQQNDELNRCASFSCHSCNLCRACEADCGAVLCMLRVSAGRLFTPADQFVFQLPFSAAIFLQMRDHALT